MRSCTHAAVSRGAGVARLEVDKGSSKSVGTGFVEGRRTHA